MLIGLLLTLALLQQSEPVTCTIVEPGKSITCPLGRNPKNKLITLRIDHWEESAVDTWRWNVEYVQHPGGGRDISYNQPLKKEPLVKGQKVKVTVDEWGRLIPLERCDVRVWQQVKESTKQGHQPSLSTRRQPDDCMETVRY